MADDMGMMSRMMKGEWWVLVSDFQKEVKKRNARIAELDGELVALRTKLRELGTVPPSPPAPSMAARQTDWEKAGARSGKTETVMREMARSLGLKDEVMESIGFPSPEYGTFREWWESASSKDLGYVSPETARRIWVAACRRQEKSKRKGGK